MNLRLVPLLLVLSLAACAKSEAPAATGDAPAATPPAAATNGGAQRWCRSRMAMGKCHR